MGRIRLLNTDAGKQAMALVDAGVPLHISSRAAGVVEGNGHVKIKKMFTYDLVADPGFANAELKRVNESFGFADDDLIQIYELPQQFNENFTEDKYTKTELSEMDSTKYITIEDFNEYTKYIKNEVENLKKSVSESTDEKTSSTNEGLVRYAEETAKRVNQIQGYVGKLAESVDGLISHNDYIVENLEKVKDYAEMIGEKTNQGINYSEKLAESVDHLIEYTKVVAEKADQGIQYTKLVAEKTDQNIEYTNYIGEETSNRWNYQSYINEQVDNLISHNDYIVEGTSSIIEYTDYLKEQTENLTNYMNHVVEKINEGISVDSKSTSINESIDEFKTNLDSKINSILESAKSEKKSLVVENVENNLHFLNFLSESKRNQFESLNEQAKEKIVSAFSTTKYYGSADAERLFESVFIGIRPVFNWLTNMPEKYKTMWNGLNESQKNAIKAQASLRVLDTQYKIDDFWATRDLRISKIEAPINESLEIMDSPEYKTPSSYLETVEAELRRRFKK
jgi:methyl-accepting chemotaxis protein